jgi:hypothetical protein
MSFCDVEIISAFSTNITFDNANNLLKTKFKRGKVTFPKTTFETSSNLWQTFYAEEPMTRTHNHFSIRFLDIQKQGNTFDFAVGVAALPKYRESVSGGDELVGWRDNEWAYIGTTGCVINAGQSFKNYGPEIIPGDTITVVLNAFNAEIEYQVNGKFLGVAHHVPLDVPLYPAISSICKKISFEVVY